MIRDLLIYEKEYHCYLNGEYLGVATYTNDKNIGDAFISMSISDNGELIHEVYLPDEWELK